MKPKLREREVSPHGRMNTEEVPPNFVMKSPFGCKTLGSTLKFLEPLFSPLTFRMKAAIWNKVEGRKNGREGAREGRRERERNGCSLFCVLNHYKL